MTKGTRMTDAAPVAAEGADATLERLRWLRKIIRLHLRTEVVDVMDEVIRELEAARPAPAAAPREGAPLLLACIERVEVWLARVAAPTDVFVALGVVLDVAREAARGEG
jgi:hypothetical protein